MHTLIFHFIRWEGGFLLRTFFLFLFSFLFFSFGAFHCPPPASCAPSSNHEIRKHLPSHNAAHQQESTPCFPPPPPYFVHFFLSFFLPFFLSFFFVHVLVLSSRHAKYPIMDLQENDTGSRCMLTRDDVYRSTIHTYILTYIMMK